ncbi:Yip1 family protein [Novosphingobium sp. ZN18A2]|uniref:Yip1 family protein n=1 Tax=Novosphingobium sp. ZN18A2 TaxID=3079861 RepID=UPI0030D5BF9A
MTDTQTPAAGHGLVERAKAIILNPAEQWPKIAAETESPGDIFVRYAMPLAAIGPVAQFIGGQMFGVGAFGFSYKPGFFSGLGSAVLSYVLSLLGLVVLTFIADWLAPRFDGKSDRARAFKLVAYAATAGWIAGIFALIPMLGWLSLLGLYSFYLFYTGAAPLMQVPGEKVIGYTVVTVIVAAVLYIVVGALVGTFAAMLFGGNLATHVTPNDRISGTMTIPGVGKVNMDKIQNAADRLEARSKGDAKAVSPDSLKALLPQSIGGFQRTSVESTGIGALGSNAEGTYENGDQRFTLRISDLNAAGALAGIGAAMGVSQSKEDANGYERTGVVDGQMQTEKWDSSSNSGTFGRAVDDRYMIQADGNVGNIDQLKQAVAAIDRGKLTSLGG